MATVEATRNENENIINRFEKKLAKSLNMVANLPYEK